MNKCENCGTEFEGKFCPECGRRATDGGACPNCGAPRKGGEKFCSECGYSFVGQSAAASGAKVQAAKYYKILSVLPAVFTALFAVLTILAFFVMPAVTVFGLPSEALFEDFKINGILGYECLDGAAGATLVFGFVALALSAGYFACAFLRSCSEAKIKIGKRNRDLPFIFDIFSVLIMLAQLITSAVCMGIIGADDGGLGLVKPGAGLIVPLVFSILFLFAVPACSQINKRIILRRNPEARRSSYYFTVRNEFTSAVPAPEVKENSELYSRCVKYYRQRAALIVCNIFFIVTLMNLLCYAGVGGYYDFAVMHDLRLILSCMFASVGLFVSLIIFFRSKRWAIKKLTDVEHFNKVRNRKFFCFTALFSMAFALPWFILNCLTHTDLLKYYVITDPQVRSPVCSIVGLYFEIAIFSVCLLYCFVLAISLIVNGLKIDKVVNEKIERPKCVRKLKWWWNIIPCFMYYAFVVEIIWAVHYFAAKRTSKIGEEEFKAQIDKYGEYFEYKKQLAVYKYKAHSYAKDRLIGEQPDIKAFADAAAGRTKVWLYNNAAYLVLAAVAVVSLVVIIAVAAVSA